MTKSITPKNIVLYADDDQDDRELVRDAFAQYSHNVEVITVTDGSEALSYLDQLSPFDPTPCLVILDINMPVFNGKEVLTRIREKSHLQELPVVLFSTSSQPADIHFAHKYDAGFITKPLDIEQMQVIADQFIEHCTEDIRNKIRKQMK